MSNTADASGHDNQNVADNIMKSSSAYVSCVQGDKTLKWHFTGVLSVEHNLSLNLETTPSEDKDIVNGAKNQPTQIALSVMETDTEHTEGWSRKMLSALSSVKKLRLLCTVYTTMGTYPNMLLTGISALQDEEVMDGWKGTLTFTEYISANDASSGLTASAKSANNSSTQTNIGTGLAIKLTEEQLIQLLQRAGVIL